MALLRHLLQQPRRCYLLAEVVPRVNGQPEVAVHERHKGQRGGQPRELGLLRGSLSAPAAVPTLG